jgi:hypothetical protein
MVPWAKFILLNFGVVRIRGAGRDKAPLPLTGEAASLLMHDSDIFQWMKPDPGAFRLTGSAGNFPTGPIHRPIENRENFGAA